MRYRILPVTPLQQNCSLIWCEASRRAALVDPGGEAERLLEAVAAKGLELECLLLTHGHVDHVGAAPEIAARAGVPILGPHEGDRFWLESLAQQAQMFGLEPARAFTPDRWLEEGETVSVGEQRLEVLHCPGHTPGHVVFYHAAEQLAFVGDVLFHGAIGRTDFPGGDHAALLGAIRRKLFPLGDEVHFVPGHGVMSTFGEERRHNPFVGEFA